MKAIIELDDVPEFQIGQIVRVSFPDSAVMYGKCGQASGWVSVTDAMPQDEMVVVIVKHKIGWYWVPAWHDEFGWHSSAREFKDGESKYVTHWMPLPEPPEEVTGDEQD